ncbi:unnamed protein product [Blepharisma stoltei]|uniref:START domain-containing protein n=1 Tax=Blepharisma stoltei TaxID=1481888 RepID=A0AAU9JD87_9CILI|nr:unnamed protein product [Blepharisma stoltei]
MGCCESRDKSKDRAPEESTYQSFMTYTRPPTPANYEIVEEAKSLGLKPLNEEDKEAYERYLYIESLENSNSWEKIKHSGWFDISKLNGTTKYDSHTPVSKIWFSLGTKVELSIILDFLNEPKKRLSWDKNFKTYEIIDGNFPTNYTIYFLIKLFAYKGDYIEKRVVAYDKDSVVVVYYSVENEQRPKQRWVSRGITHIGLTRIRIVNGKIEFVIIGQSDPSSTLAKLAQNVGIGLSDEWCKKYKSAILEARKGSENRRKDTEILEENKCSCK